MKGTNQPDKQFIIGMIKPGGIKIFKDGKANKSMPIRKKEEMCERS